MSEESHAHRSRQLLQGRTTPGRPPIQWPNITQRTLNDSQNRAADLARTQVDRAHSLGAVHSNKPKVIQPLDDRSSTPVQQAPSEQTPHTMREEPFDWHAYHSAWQHYYHRYFYQYYAQWWRQQSARTAPQAQNNAAPAEIDASSELRQKLRTTVATRTKKIQASSHFKPALAATLAGLIFLFVNYNQVIVGAVKQYIAPGSVVTTPVIVEPNTNRVVGSDPRLIIPKIGVDVPVVYDESRVDESSYQKALERGVVRLGNTADPGTKGNVVIGGHSSNNVLNAGGYKYVFVNLKRLEKGDVFYLNYKGVRYTYKVTVAKKIISPTDVSVLAQTDKPIVTLFTCDPPGTNINRLIVQAEQVDPDPSGAKQEDRPTNIDKTNPLPSVAPSIWDRLF